MVDVEQILNLLELDEKIPEAAHPIPAKISANPKIEFRNVSFTYDWKLPPEEQTTIIDNLSFTVEPGTSVGIVGQTGSGKSTIMRLLYRFYDVKQDSGQILIDGQDISQMKIRDLRNHIAIVPQDCVLFNDTILYNIAYGALNDPVIRGMIDDPNKSGELIEYIVPAAKRSSIHPLIMTTNLGYYGRVGERGLKLSGGEKQRVAIARALLKKSPIMMFDEATSALDTETEK
jgi:ATP-binding cassette subfamily B (MDR/TAP) protein 6